MLSQQLLLPLDPPEATSRPQDFVLRANSFKRRISERSSGRIIQVTLTRNRSTILSAKPVATKGLAKLAGLPKKVTVRIHRCFVDAPDAVLEAAADFASKRLTRLKRREALDVLRDYFDQNAPETAASPPSKRRLSGPKGKHHDLSELFASLNTEYFDEELELTVSWGTPPKRRSRRRRTIQLGSFHDETQTVRIHPVLDHREVPSYVVLSVLHHEMVHAVVPAERAPGSTRRRIHTAEFRRKEREFKQLEPAEAWLERHLFRLMGRVERKLASRR